jgi:hypothetical protein
MVGLDTPGRGAAASGGAPSRAGPAVAARGAAAYGCGCDVGASRLNRRASAAAAYGRGSNVGAPRLDRRASGADRAASGLFAAAPFSTSAWAMPMREIIVGGAPRSAGRSSALCGSVDGACA